MKTSIRQHTRPAFALAVVIVLVGNGLSYLTIRKLASTAEWVAQTQAVLTELEATLSTITDAETGRRGYIITGEEQDLEPYHAALPRIDPQLRRLREMTADNGYEQRLLNRLEALVALRIANLKKSAELRESAGFASPRQIRLTAEGNAAMNGIRQGIADMKKHVQQVLKERTAAAKRGAGRAVLLVGICTLLGLGIIVVGSYLLNGEVIQRELAEEDLRKLNERLEARVRERTAELEGINKELKEQIAQRARAEAERSRLVTAIEQSAEAVVITDTEGTIQYVSPPFTTITGYTREDAVGQSVWILESAKRDPAFYQNVWATVRAGQVWHGELVNRRKDGTLYNEYTTIAPVRNDQGTVTSFVAIKQDITARKQVEQQLLQLQKMETIGRLAGGVAHDFNNLLMVVVGCSDLLLAGMGEHDPLRRHVAMIKQAGERGSSLTRQLLAFSRRQIFAVQELDLNAIVSNLEKMLVRLVGEDIELLLRLSPDLGRVKGDRGQIEQVIMNLALNARDAMPQGGKLTIETANVELDEDYARCHAAVTPGPHVMLAVTDTGCGMDTETQTHIFEPSFSTKEDGKGTGLGLSTVYGIVKQSGGNIWVYSELGQGTTFKVYLARVEAAVPRAPAASAPAARTGGTETILLAEDDRALRSLVHGTLESYGYKVLPARNGKEALAVCQQHTGPIHLLLTDLVMPEMSGRQLAEDLARFRRETKVLYMSGYTNNVIVHHGVLDGGVNLVQKPISPGTLAQKVREVLDAA